MPVFPGAHPPWLRRMPIFLTGEFGACFFRRRSRTAPPFWIWPNIWLRLGRRKVIGGFKTGRHRCRSAGEHLVMLNVKKSQPALLAKRKPDHTAELDQFGLAKVAMHPVPEGIIGIEAPNDRLGISERGLLAFVVFRRFFEVQEIKHMLFAQRAGFDRFHRALIATIFAGDRA